jgi:hypothetical protein
MLGARLAAFLAPVTYIIGLIFALCWLFRICGPLEFLWSVYLWLSQALLGE